MSSVAQGRDYYVKSPLPVNYTQARRGEYGGPSSPASRVTEEEGAFMVGVRITGPALP